MSALTTEGSLTVEQVPIDRLRPDPANPRRIGRERLDSPRPPVGRPHGQCRSQTPAPSVRVCTDEFPCFSVARGPNNDDEDGSHHPLA
jgi:hypothetical protein